ncbi:hypothetical protein SK803_38970 [Lentzea sp. BCCO 10_0856]|uniref:Uncharacterized protein n=1 Tax=Lentzea miocenica TaxID=3095431 RepID=A0ABU4TDE8_9PSEU|nr:hypothetical protein [Lentzea sp. BCCO 10_0856]MDX8036214.1 hypothetical protein [Lentzea sp. BCCO 10_0856]
MSDDPTGVALSVIEAARRSTAELIGERWLHIGRACDLVWLGFGPYREVTDHRGGTREIGEYALHLQCPWRVTCGDRLVTRSSHIYVPGPDWTGDGDFDWDVRGANRFDVRAGELTAHLAGERIVVTSVEVTERGDLTVALSDGLRIEALRAGSVRDESWRFFRPHRDDDHVVVFEEED